MNEGSAYEGAAFARDVTARCDGCVVGTGPGGAVVAKELAERGARVIPLEQGPRIGKADVTQREEEMLPRLYDAGGLLETRDHAFRLLAGRGIGGSTLQNGCLVFDLPRTVRDRWTGTYGVPGLDDERWAPLVTRGRATISATRIREGEVNLNNARLRRGRDALGWAGGIADHNRVECRQGGFCARGCPLERKHVQDLRSGCGGAWGARVRRGPGGTAGAPGRLRDARGGADARSPHPVTVPPRDGGERARRRRGRRARHAATAAAQRADLVPRAGGPASADAPGRPRLRRRDGARRRVAGHPGVRLCGGVLECRSCGRRRGLPRRHRRPPGRHGGGVAGHGRGARTTHGAVRPLSLRRGVSARRHGGARDCRPPGAAGSGLSAGAGRPPGAARGAPERGASGPRFGRHTRGAAVHQPDRGPRRRRDRRAGSVSAPARPACGVRDAPAGDGPQGGGRPDRGDGRVRPAARHAEPVGDGRERFSDGDRRAAPQLAIMANATRIAFRMAPRTGAVPGPRGGV